jgi:Sulfotransferase family
VKRNYLTHFSQGAIDRITSLAGQIDTTAYRIFKENCEAHRPWIWKDPRLWMTVRFWHEAVDLSDCCFVLMTRNHFHCWVSTITRRVILSYGHMHRYEQSVQESIVSFLEENRLPFVDITYEGLIRNPTTTIARLNRFLGTNLNVQQLQAAYHGPLYKTPTSPAKKIFMAGLIYLRNYRARADL